MAFFNVVLDFFDIVELEINFDEQEGNVHFFTDFDGLFKGEVVCFDGEIKVFVVVIDLGFIEE